MKRSVLLAPLALLALTGPLAAKPTRTPPAEIAFANHGGIDDWRSDGDRTIYFKGNGNRWYKAVLFAPATDLGFREGLRIDTGPTDTLDKWSAVIIHGQRYPFTSFEAIAGKPPKSAR